MPKRSVAIPIPMMIAPRGREYFSMALLVVAADMVKSWTRADRKRGEINRY